jgi:hypothetical protein
MYGERSPSNIFHTATYAVPLSNDEPSIWLTRPDPACRRGDIVQVFAAVARELNDAII